MNIQNEVHIKTYQGLTNAVIAESLKLSERTVKRYRKTESPIVHPECFWYKAAARIVEEDYEDGCKLICYLEEGKKKAEVREGNIEHYSVTEPVANSLTWEEVIEDLMKIDFPLYVEAFNDIKGDYNDFNC